MGCKAAVQALQKADVLKSKIYRKCDLLSDSEAWTNQQQLQTIYHQVLVLDLEYALDKKVEQELWTVGFKNHISTLQEQARNKKDPHRSEAQALLSWCLEAASGFYLTLLHELCIAFDLDLPFRKRLSNLSQTKSLNSSEQVNPPQASSCIYICQYCLVHLGDIARYRNQRNQAESFYKHAVLLSPTSGQPYNQLALLETSQGDKLSAIFYYVRGIAVKNPFPATATNLANTFLVAVDKDNAITQVQTKLTVGEFIRMFVTVHGLMYAATDLPQAELQVKSLNMTLTPLVATHSFTKLKLIQMTVINLYALRHTVGAGTLKIDELTEDEKKIRHLVLDLLAGSLSAFLLPIYTLNEDSSLLDYHALAAIKFLLCWIKSEPEVLKESVFQTRLQIWPGLCKLLNSIQVFLNDFDYTKHMKTPLSEDVDLQGFLPFSEYFAEFDFNKEKMEEDCETEKLIRCKRLIEFGMWLTTFDANNFKLIVTKENNDGSLTFEPGCVQPDPTTELLEEMKSFNIVETIQLAKSKGSEKRGGILKPQGSLEKSRKEQEEAGLTDLNASPSGRSLPSIKQDTSKLKRASQNVALQSIFKKLEENKQVKFDMGNVENEKSPKSEIKTLGNSTFSNPLYNLNSSTPNELQSDYFKNGFQSYSNPPYERNVQNIPFAKPDAPIGDIKTFPPNFSIPPPNHLFNMPPPPIPNMNQPPPTGFPPTLPLSRPPPQPSQPMSYPSLPQCNNSQEFKKWQHEERPQQNWWPNPPQPVSSNYPQRDFQVNYPYINNMPYAHQNMEFNKQPPTGNNQRPNMISSPWSSTPNNVTPSNGIIGHNYSNQSLSLRQAMLKETKNVASLPPISNSNRENENLQAPQTSTPGYSLFNSTVWSPNIPGQYRNTTSPSEGLMNNLRHQSLFSRQPPPLQQLLERQNQLQKGDS